MSGILVQGYDTQGQPILNKDGHQLDLEYLKRYQCVHCHLILRVPVQLACGDPTCKVCLPSVPFECPCCGEHIDPSKPKQYFSDRSCLNDIKEFTVVCKCGQKYSLDDWEDHFKSCRAYPTKEECLTRQAIMDEMRLKINILHQKATSGVYIWGKTREAMERHTLNLYSPPFFTSPHGYRCIPGIGKDIYRLKEEGTGSSGRFNLFGQAHRAPRRATRGAARGAVMRNKQVPCFHNDKGCTWTGLVGQEYEEHVKECQFMTTKPEKARVAIPDTPVVGVIQSGHKLVSFRLIEDCKLKKALSSHRDPQSETKQDSKSSLPNKISESMEGAVENGISPQEPVLYRQQSEMDHQQPEVDRQQSEMDHQQPEVDHQQPEVDHQQPEVDRQQPEMDHQQPEVDHQQPEVDHQQPEVDHQQPEVDHQQPEVDHQQPEVDHQQPEVDHQQPDVDHQQSEVDHKQPEVDQKPILNYMDKTHAVQLLSTLALTAMNQNSSQDIVPEDEAVLQLRELIRAYPEPMARFLQSLKKKCDSTEGIREVSVGLLQDRKGGMHSTVMTESMLRPEDLAEVYKEIYEIRDDWYNIGLELKVPTTVLDRIRSTNPDNAKCLLEVLQMWLTTKIPGEESPSWRSLTKALRSPTIGKSLLADELERKYCSSHLEPGERNLSGLYDDLYAIRECWNNLGLKLGLTQATLCEIKRSCNSPKDCLREVLRHWLLSDSVNRTPKALCDALHSVTVGADVLANELEKKYCLYSGKLQEIPTSDPQYHGEVTAEKMPSFQLHGNRKRSTTADEIPSSAKRPRGTIQSQQHCGHGNIQVSVEGGGTVNVTMAPPQVPL